MLKHLKDKALNLLIMFCDFLAVKQRVYVKEKTLLLVRLDAIGDYVLFRNFIKVLKESERFRTYRFTLCGNVVWRDLSENYDKDYIDDFIWVDRAKFYSKHLLYRFRTLRHVGARGFETAIHSVYSRDFFWGDAIVRASQARERIGSAGDLGNMVRWQKNCSDRYYTKLIASSRINMFEFSRNKEFIQNLLGTAIDMAKPYVAVRPGKTEHFSGSAPVVLFPGAGKEFRRWSAKNFAEIADYLDGKYKGPILIAGGSNDRPLAERIISLAKSKRLKDVTGQFSLSDLLDVLSKSSLLISNETGAVHLAVLAGIKVLCISNGNHFGRFNPYPEEISDKVLYIYPKPIMDKLPDFDCLKEQYRFASPLNINDIGVQDVKMMIDKVVHIAFRN